MCVSEKRKMKLLRVSFTKECGIWLVGVLRHLLEGVEVEEVGSSWLEKDGGEERWRDYMPP